jgi:hypothetical protein
MTGMIRLLLPLLLLVTAAALPAFASEDYRTFTDREGRTIRAAIIRATESDVWIRREDGRTFQVSLATFVERDQKFVADWRRIQALQMPQSLEFATRRFTDGRQTSNDSLIRTTVERVGYVVTLTNRSPVDLDNLQVEYRYYIRQGSPGVTGQNRPVRSESGTATIARLASRGTAEFRTNVVTLRATQLRQGVVYTSTGKTRTTDDLRGIWIRVRQGDEVIAEFSSPPNLSESESW